MKAARPDPGAPRENDLLRTADEAVAQWGMIVSALSPIIGLRGVDALFRRTLVLGQASFAWIELPPESRPMDLECLRGALLRREAAEAAHASATLFSLFHDLLYSLIGPALSDRLLPFPRVALPASASAGREAPHA